MKIVYLLPICLVALAVVGSYFVMMPSCISVPFANYEPHRLIDPLGNDEPHSPPLGLIDPLGNDEPHSPPLG